MNYSKSLSELLFEDHEGNDLVVERKKKNKAQKDASEQSSTAEDLGASQEPEKTEEDNIVATLEEVSSAAFFLVPKDEFPELSVGLKTSSEVLRITRKYLSKEPASRSNNRDTPQDIENDNSAAGVLGLERGDRTADVPYNYVENRVDVDLSKAFKIALQQGNRRGVKALEILKKIQTKFASVAGSKYKVNFLNRTKEDTESVTAADALVYEKLGCVFFTLIFILFSDNFLMLKHFQS